MDHILLYIFCIFYISETLAEFEDIVKSERSRFNAKYLQSASASDENTAGRSAVDVSIYKQ